MTIIGLIVLILLAAPFLLIRQPIQRFARLSFFVALIFLLPIILATMPFFSTGKTTLTLGALVSYSESFSLATVALLPLALKSTVLLRKHEIRMFNYILNISIFLLMALVQPIVQVITFFGKVSHHVFASF